MSGDEVVGWREEGQGRGEGAHVGSRTFHNLLGARHRRGPGECFCLSASSGSNRQNTACGQRRHKIQPLQAAAAAPRQPPRWGWPLLPPPHPHWLSLLLGVWVALVVLVVRQALHTIVSAEGAPPRRDDSASTAIKHRSCQVPKPLTDTTKLTQQKTDHERAREQDADVRRTPPPLRRPRWPSSRAGIRTPRKPDPSPSPQGRTAACT